MGIMVTMETTEVMVSKSSCVFKMLYFNVKYLITKGDYGDYGSESQSSFLSGDCLPCESSLARDNRPTPEQFGQTIGWFLSANPGDVCPSGKQPIRSQGWHHVTHIPPITAGHAAYGESVKLEQSEGGLMKVGSSNFMAFHSILKTSKDYYMALAR